MPRPGSSSLGRVALDGTKLRASASRHKAMSHERMGPKIEELKAQVAAMLAEAEAVDRAEDEEFGEDKRGDELPKELGTREGRLAKLRAAKAAIEAEAKEKAATKAAAKAAADGKNEAAITEAAEAAAATATPSKASQRNFTDPESRMMKTTDGFHYAYNGQAVVDEASQVVLAAEVVQAANDIDQLFDMIDVTEQNLEAADIDESPEMVLADAGYCSEDNLTKAADGDIDVLIATGRIKAHERVSDTPRGPIPKDATQRERMARRLRTKAGTGRLRPTQGHRRTRLRSDEGPTTRRLPPAPRTGRSPRRVDPARDLSQPPQARQCWLHRPRSGGVRRIGTRAPPHPQPCSGC